MKIKVLKALAVLPGTLIILGVLALPWVTARIAHGRYPEQQFPYLPFSNQMVEGLSGTIILFELFCVCLVLIAAGISLTQVGLDWYDRREARKARAISAGVAQ